MALRTRQSSYKKLRGWSWATLALGRRSVAIPTNERTASTRGRSIRRHSDILRRAFLISSIRRDYPVSWCHAATRPPFTARAGRLVKSSPPSRTRSRLIVNTMVDTVNMLYVSYNNCRSHNGGRLVPPHFILPRRCCCSRRRCRGSQLCLLLCSRPKGENPFCNVLLLVAWYNCVHPWLLTFSFCDRGTTPILTSHVLTRSAVRRQSALRTWYVIFGWVFSYVTD